jgi:hypothetical protein
MVWHVQSRPGYQFLAGPLIPGLCSLFPDGLRLHRHDFLHRLRQFHILHFTPFDFDTPLLGRSRDIVSQQTIDLVSFLQDLVEVMLADNVA